MKIGDKMVSLMYKLTNTCDPRTPESLYLGGTRMCDIPQLVDEFMMLWLIEYDKKMWRFWIFRPLVEWLFINERFVKFSEFQEVFKGTNTSGLSRGLFSSYKDQGESKIDDLKIRHPIFRLAGIGSEKARQQFIMNYKEDDLTSYFAFMKKKNPVLYTIFHDWHKVAVPKKYRIHSWITGTPGSGKSELMKSMILQDIRQNLKKDCSIIVIDPNGDFTREVAQFKENAEPAMKNKLMYLDLDLFKGHYTPVINPFEIQATDNLEREIDLQNQQIGQALVEICESFGQPLTNQQQTLMYNCVNVLLEREGSSLWDLHTFASLAKNDVHSLPLVEAGKNSNNPSIRNFFRTMWENIASFKESKAGVLVKTTTLLGMPSFANLISGPSTINLRNALDNNKLVLFNLAIGNLGDKAPIYIGKIIVSLLQSLSFQRAALEKEERKTVYLYIDEFQDYVSDSMIRILTQGRKYKMYLTVANQFVGQGMDSEEQDAIFGTTKIKIIGANSFKSLNALSKETDAEIAILKKLQVGEFMVKIADGEPFILHGSIESLDNKNAMTDRQWQQIVQEQKANYYRKRPIDDVLAYMKQLEDDPNAILNTPPTDESTQQPIDRTKNNNNGKYNGNRKDNNGNKGKNNNDKGKNNKPPFNPKNSDKDDANDNDKKNEDDTDESKEQES